MFLALQTVGGGIGSLKHSFQPHPIFHSVLHSFSFVLFLIPVISQPHTVWLQVPYLRKNPVYQPFV